MKTFNWKSFIPYVVAIMTFVVMALAYCSPMLSGKVLRAGDVNNWKGAANEAIEYRQQTGETTWWTNSMFGGMPTFQITGSMPSGKLRKALENIFHFGFDNAIGIIIAYMIGFYLMLLCFGVNPWLSLAGAIALAFSSYFFIIIPAGHMTKASAIGFLAPMIGGFYAVFRKKYWLGAPVFMVFGAIGSNLHPQMTYYVGLLMGVFACAELYIHIKERRWKDLAMSLLVLVVAGGMVVATKASWMQMNNSYLKQTMRGGHSELTKDKAVEQNKDKGLDIEYATAWSYDIDETLTLLVPNVKGGASGYALSDKSQTYQALVKNGYPKKQAAQACRQLPMYWGTQPFTSGPVYVGAIVCLLFLLGLIVVKGPYKWALLIATLFSVMLAWGKNFMPMTELFFNYFPMYNKFRAVSSVLIVAEITMPLLGFMALQQIVEEKKNGTLDFKRTLVSLYVCAGITAGICLFLALFGGMLWDFKGHNDPQWLQQALVDDRRHLLSVDAWRSFAFVAATALLLWAYLKYNVKNVWLYAVIAVLVVADIVPVDRRYFGSGDFISDKEDKSYFAIQPWEQQILQDKSLDYRVLNVNTNTFNDARTSYRLKSVGGYSAVKLRRYQDLIDEHISKNNMAVLNMLNTKYIVTQNGVMRNPDAMGNAWFVDNVKYVDTPDEESEALWNLAMQNEAVADRSFSNLLPENTEGSGNIELIEYKPNSLSYSASADADKVAVFSEIYYPEGWHLYIDGKEASLARVNYILRAALIPAGEHMITMQFVPQALKTDRLSLACFILLLLLSVVVLCSPLYASRISRK
ncbi:MAG: YfhO family protein [Paludibacteraceae bacterium]|nr:YfhO family protein [Paludibacteraceae bacterium]